MTAKTTDWRTLLVRYIAHVGQAEGSTFLTTYYSPLADILTPGELAILRELDQLLDIKGPPPPGMIGTEDPTP